MDLQGKVTLLFFSNCDMTKWHYSAFNDLYMKIQGRYHNLVEVVWVAYCEEDLFKRVAADAPCPMLHNLILSSLEHFFSLIEFPLNLTPCPVLVLDGKGRISNKNAFEIIERWGVEAFPFSQGREEELRNSEWEMMCNCSQFLFQNLPSGQSEVKLKYLFYSKPFFLSSLKIS